MKHILTKLQCFYLICIIFIILTCCTFEREDEQPTNPLAIELLSKAKSNIIVGNTSIQLTSAAYRDFQPGLGNDGLKIYGKLTSTIENGLPRNLEIKSLYVLNENYIWQPPKLELNYDFQLIEIIAQNGPKWEMKSEIKVIVELALNQEDFYFLKSESTELEFLY